MIPFFRGFQFATGRAHPLLAGYPIAFFAMALIWEAAALFDPWWWKFALGNLAAGLVLAVPAVIRDLIDTPAIAQGEFAESHWLWRPIAELIAVLCLVASLAAMVVSFPTTEERMPLALGLGVLGLAVAFTGRRPAGRLALHQTAPRDRRDDGAGRGGLPAP